MDARRMKKLLKKYLGDFIEEHGFTIYKGHGVIRIKNRIIQGISFGGSAWDKNQITVTLFLQPLFIPSDIMHVSFGGRIGDFLGGKDWFTLKDEESTENAFKEIRNFLDEHAVYWFSMTNSSQEILDNMKKHPDYPGFKCGRKVGETFQYMLGYIALDAERYDEAKEYFEYVLKIHEEAKKADEKSKRSTPEWSINRAKEIKYLLNSLNDPEKIKQILDENTKKTAEALRIKLEDIN